MARCPNCEKVNPDNAQHCAYCGAAMSGAAPVRTGAAEPRERVREPIGQPIRGPGGAVPAHSSARRLLPWLALVALVLVGGILAGALLFHGGSGPSPASVATVTTRVVTEVVTVTPPPTVRPVVVATTSAARPSVTATPTTISTADTPPGTMLSPGRTWIQGDIDMTLRAQLDGNRMQLYLDLKNTADQRNSDPDIRRYRFTRQNIDAADDTGRPVPLKATTTVFSTATFDDWDIAGTLRPGQQVTLKFASDPTISYADYMYLDVDVSRLSIQYETVTIGDLAGIPKAQWKVPFPH